MNSFEDSILRVMKGDSVVGAAFLVSDRLVATCAHVVESAGVEVGEKISLSSSDGKVIEAIVEAEFWRGPSAEDISILRLKEPVENIQPVILGSSTGTKGHKFSTFGFPKQGQELSGSGEIIGQATIDRIKVLQLRSPEVTPGFSGAPIFDNITKRGVGMVVAITPPDEYQRLGTTAFAIPSETIREICTELQISDICPYRSLDVFNEDDGSFFFGRDRVVQKMIDSLKREPRFLAVLGPSGSGKSSVVRAGLIPALRQGKVLESDQWEILTVRPASQPLEQLDSAGLSQSQNGLEKAVRAWLASYPEKTRLVLVIDQFEEVFVSTSEDIRQKFIKELANALDAPIAITIVLTLRDDFFSRFINEAAALVTWLQRNQYIIPSTLDEDELRAMVLEPAKTVGLNFEDGLVDIIINDAVEADRSKEKAQSTILPLLEFALTQLWEKRQDERLTHNAYHTIGGVTGGLSQWADRAYHALNTNEQKLARDIFCDLVHLGDEKDRTPDTRRVQPINKLRVHKEKTIVETVVNKLVQARLLSTLRDSTTGQEFIEIIHEALLSEWGMLKKWIEDFRNRERIARDRRRRWITVGLALGLATMVLLFVFALGQRNEALRQARISKARELASAALTNLSIDPERSILLAIQAVSVTYMEDEKYVVPEAEDALHQAMQASRAQLTLISHTDFFYGVAYSPDGKRLATVSTDKTAKVWDATTGQLLLTMNGHEDWVIGVAFSPDGKRLATASKDETAKVWNAITGELQLTLGGHSDRVNSVAFSSDGSRLATASDDGTTKVWDSASGKLQLTLADDGDWVNCVTFSPDGKRLATASTDKTAKVWDATTGEEILVLNEHNSDVYGISYSPDGTRLATASHDKTAKVWDAITGQELFTLTGHTNSVEAIAFSPDGKRLATAGFDYTAKVWDAATGQLQLTLPGHTDWVYGVAFSPDGMRLATTSFDLTAKIWDVTASKELLTISGHANEVFGVTFSPDGTRLATASMDGTTKVWEVSTGKLQLTLAGHTGWVYDAVFSPDGKRLATVSTDRTSKVWDATTGQELFTFTGHADEVYGIAFSPDGTRLATIGLDKTAIVWDATTGQELFTLTGHNSTVFGVAYSLDGKRLATTSFDNTAKVWDATTGELELTLTGHTDWVYGVAFSPDGTRLATASRDKTARLWDATTGQELLTMTGHTDQVLGIAFSPDGMRLATAGRDTTARVWDAMTGQQLFTLTGQTDIVYRIAFSPDGKYLAIASADKTARVYVLSIEDLMALARSRLTRTWRSDECQKYLQMDTCPQ